MKKILFLLIPLLLMAFSCNLPALFQETTPTEDPSGLSTTQEPGVDAIVYYYYVPVEDNAYPEGSVVIMADTLVLAPTASSFTRSADTPSDLTTALLLMLRDRRNDWSGNNMGVSSVNFNSGRADVALQGDVSVAGDIQLIALRFQILLTVFAEPGVQSALVTLNGKNISNLGVSNAMYADPEDYTYPRAEIETFMAENSYVKP
jgi:hypothetical protein